MTRRPSSLKIPDIKMVRGLTRFLGKIGVEKCFSKFYETVYHYDTFNHPIGSTQELKYFYGWGLKESKDYVEAKYDYYLDQLPHTPRQAIEYGNRIAQIKALRVHNKFLNQLGIRSADAGLKVCKEFNDRNWKRARAR